MKIYLAGKMTDWRYDIVDGLEAMEDSLDGKSSEWPVMPGAVLGEHDYTGPYLASSCPDMRRHGIHKIGYNHGLCQWCEYSESEAEHQVWIKDRCLEAVKNADLVFAHIEKGAFATLFELGYALALGKPVWANWSHSTDKTAEQLWFIKRACTSSYCDLPITALGAAISSFRSQVATQKALAGASFIEKAFHEAWVKTSGGNPFTELVYGLKVDRYSIDFAHPSTKTGIELDGMVGHSSPADIEKDRVRQRRLESMGWRFIRFGGREVTQNAEACAVEAQLFLSRRKSA